MSDKENLPVTVPPRPDYGRVPPRPSDGWLINPGWMDGGFDPPHVYHSNEEIAATLWYWKPDHPLLHQPRHTPAIDPALTSSGSDGPAAPSASPSSDVIPPAAATVSDPVAPPENADNTSSATGHGVNVTMLFTITERPPAGRGKPATKKHKDAKFDYVNLTEIDRVKFIIAFLKMHALGDDYSPGVNSGPPFKFWWTGSSGGKGGAITIDTDRQFSLALEAILKKNRATCTVGVEFDIDTMEGFRVRKRPLGAVDTNSEEPELLYGTKVPRLDAFDEDTQVNGRFILEIKKRWPCQKHQGEHGEPGFCYVDPSGNHLGLNNRKCKLWAAAIAAGDTTKHEPPNTVDFDGARDGRLTAVKPRGRHGPHPPPSMSTSSSGNDTISTLLLTAMLPMITTMTQNSMQALNAASGVPAPVTPHRQNKLQIPLSPVHAEGSELHACLVDFFVKKDINLLECEKELAELDLTPDIMADVPVERLCQVTGAVEGRVRKFRVFCKEWYDRLEEKKSRLVFN